MIWSTESIRSIGSVNCSEPGEAAAHLVDGEFDVREDPGLQVIIKILDIRDRFVRGIEPPVFFG